VAEQTPIHITIDEAALREQVRGVLQEELTSMARKLHMAADALDPEIIPEMLASEYQRGYNAGVAATEKTEADRG